MLCCSYTLTDFPISIRLTSLALWQSNDCPSASKAILMNMDKYFMWIHYERLRNHNKAKHNNTVCIFLGIYCMAGCWSNQWRGLPGLMANNIFLETEYKRWMYNTFSWQKTYCQNSYIRRTPVGNKIADHSDVVGASPVVTYYIRGFIVYYWHQLVQGIRCGGYNSGSSMNGRAWSLSSLC